MAIRKSIFILFVGFIALSFLFLAIPANSQAPKMEFGCCQLFFDGEPECKYPSSSDSCSGDNKTYIEDGLCDSGSGYCSGYKKEESKSSEKEI